MKGLIQPEAAILPTHKESSPAWGMQHQITPTYKASQPQKHTFSQKNTLLPQLHPKTPIHPEASGNLRRLALPLCHPCITWTKIMPKWEPMKLRGLCMQQKEAYNDCIE